MTPKPNESPIDEIHRVRREISDRFDGDINAIAEDAAKRQALSNRPVWQPDATTKPASLSSEPMGIERQPSPLAAN
jgi:hypothetical protein